MQIKKSEVRSAILEEAEKEFLAKGFENASVRKIAKAAGTTIGNFYNYFDNKEALFRSLVEDEYNSFMYFIENHNKVEWPDYLRDISDIPQWRKVLPDLIQKLMPSLSCRFVLLVECSRGTKFENTRRLLTGLLKDHFVGHMQEFGQNTATGEMAEVIAEQVLDGIMLILRKYGDGKLGRQLLAEHILYHFIGTMGLLGNWS